MAMLLTLALFGLAFVAAIGAIGMTAAEQLPKLRRAEPLRLAEPARTARRLPVTPARPSAPAMLRRAA